MSYNQTLKKIPCKHSSRVPVEKRHAAAMEKQCCHLQTLGIAASSFGKISPCIDVLLSCILSFITICNCVSGAHGTTGQSRNISNHALGSFMTHTGEALWCHSSMEQWPRHWKTGRTHWWAWESSPLVKILKFIWNHLTNAEQYIAQKTASEKILHTDEYTRTILSLPLVGNDHCYRTVCLVIGKDRTMWFIEGLLHTKKCDFSGNIQTWQMKTFFHDHVLIHV